MNIYFTFDYELYFGANTGSLQKCIIEPTDLLIQIGDLHDVKFVFFVDCGYIVKLKESVLKYPQLQKELDQLTEQLKRLNQKGHSLQLHIHPHWEDSYYNGNKWVMDTRRYKLENFLDEEIERIFDRYVTALIGITNKPPVAYRAGGWCIPPFEKIKKILLKHQITMDSTVFPGGKNTQGNYSYDFTNAPTQANWKFENDPCIIDPKGTFTEYPITAIKNSPLFFWKLFLLGRINPTYYRPIGDGVAMPAPGYRKKLLTQFTINPVSVDGYNASLLNKALREAVKKNKTDLVIMGHPKALSPFSLEAIEQFVRSKKINNAISVF